MSRPLVSNVLFLALPTTLAGQQGLLEGLAAHAAFQRPQAFAGAFDAYLHVVDDRRALDVDVLSSIMNKVFSLPSEFAGFVSVAPFPDARAAGSNPSAFSLPGIFRPPRRPPSARAGETKTVLAAAGPSEPAAAEANAGEPLTGTIDREWVRLQLAFEKVRASLGEGETQEWRRSIEILERKKDFWEDERLKALESFGSHRRRYEHDIGLGENILLDHIRRALAGLLAEVEDGDDSRVSGLRSPAALIPAPSETGRIVTALVNRDVGFGPHLTLRDHQIVTIRLFRGLLRRLVELRLEGAPVSEKLLRGTVAMPQGGGKTRTMVASFAVAIQMGLFDARAGDKFLVLNHTDQIHGQNRKVVGLLNEYFISKFGRPLRVSEYKADVKDLSGDVVIVSIPSVNSEDRRKRFERALRAALGKRGSVPVAALDEVHHSDLAQERQDSWNKLVETVRRVSPSCFRLGFTATPTPKDRPFIRIRDLDLMRAGVTPRTYVVKVQGSDLRRLKAPREGNDFLPRELSSTLLDEPDRNRRLFETVEKQALRWAEPSPSGRERLKATLYFGVDLRHARMMAEEYLKYFGSKGRGLKNRRLALLGSDRGRFRGADLEEALEAYRDGRIDQITAVVSGSTAPEVRQKVLDAAERGEIEAVFSVDLWYEGADLYMFSHIAGSRPTFSPYKKGQERGRPNRRSPKDITPQGEILFDEPKVLFDVIDNYGAFDRHLVTYGEVMNLQGYYESRPGELFDAVAGRMRDRIDREGTDAVRTPFAPKLVPLAEAREAKTRTVTEPEWGDLAEKLKGVLREDYFGDVDAMAEDLGIAPEDLEKLLTGREWEQRYDFLRRLATLLYQNREAFVEAYNEKRGVRDDALTEDDLNYLSSVLAAHEAREERGAEGGLTIEGDAGWGRQKVIVNAYTIAGLGKRTISERYWIHLLQALIVSFGAEARNESLERARREDARRIHEDLIGRLFARRGWKPDTATARGRLLHAARRALAVRSGGKLSVYHGLEGLSKRWCSPDLVPLNHWLQGRAVAYTGGRTAKAHYEEVRSLLSGLGVDRERCDDLILQAVFEERNAELPAERAWSFEPSGAGEVLLYQARRLTALRSGGRLQRDHGLADVPLQTEDSILSSWIRTGTIEFGIRTTRREFYGQVRALLEGFGMPKAEARLLIERAVFEAEGWDRRRSTASERLLFETRRLMAIDFGGRLHSNHGISGVKEQKSGNPPVSSWLAEGRFEFSRKIPPHVFYPQVRSLLQHLSGNAEKTDALLYEAVAEEQGWKTEDDTPLGRLLKRVRREVALTFGGKLPAATGFDGVPPQNGDYAYRGRQFPAAPLTRWIRGEEIVFSQGLTRGQFAAQVRALCAGLRIEGEIVEQALARAA